MGMSFFQVIFGRPIVPATIAAASSTTAFSLLLGALAFVPAVSRLPPSSALVLTAGLLTFFVGVTLLVWGNQPYALPPFSGEAPLVIGDLRIPSQAIWLVSISTIIIAGLWLLLQKTVLGRALRACAENPAAARIMV